MTKGVIFYIDYCHVAGGNIGIMFKHSHLAEQNIYKIIL